jgi:hypothetical protein
MDKDSVGFGFKNAYSSKMLKKAYDSYKIFLSFGETPTKLRSAYRLLLMTQ